MDRNTGANMVTDKHGAGKDGFTNGDPASPQSATVIDEDFVDGVQEELLNIIETASITPNATDFTQVLDGLNALFIAQTGGVASDSIDWDGTMADNVSRLREITSGGGGPATDSKRSWIISQTSGSDFVSIWATDEGWEFMYNTTWNEGTSSYVTTGGSNNGVVRVRVRADNGPRIEFLGGGISGGNFNDIVRLFGEPDPSATSSATDIVFPGSPAAYGKLTTVTGGTSVTLSADAFGAFGAVHNGSGLITVTLGNAMATSDYYVLASSASVIGGPYIVSTGITNTTTFNILVSDDAGTAVNTNSTVVTVNFFVYGVRG